MFLLQKACANQVTPAFYLQHALYVGCYSWIWVVKPSVVGVRLYPNLMLSCISFEIVLYIHFVIQCQRFTPMLHACYELAPHNHGFCGGALRSNVSSSKTFIVAKIRLLPHLPLVKVKKQKGKNLVKKSTPKKKDNHQWLKKSVRK